MHYRLDACLRPQHRRLCGGCARRLGFTLVDYRRNLFRPAGGGPPIGGGT
jgi:hypothetical protein